ncbi:DUF4148 domain-containing protein [Roseateles terrae]|uniref:DUF4148 domain-containing protein n=1 Tax=Roseateles terrae TaxID=431060 RepID=A0ABR6GRY2_9BURK|nr:DUF4148 domain-containing protein [Roseateles terrae]MBB3194873.1 hypothetical protein [Roseateles terrae]
MNKPFAFVATAFMMSTVAFAHGNHSAGEGAAVPGASPAQATVTRAEVLADLEIYRQSGLAALDSRDAPNVFGADYQQAQARYKALRSAPGFATAVARIAHERGETAVAAEASRVASSQ